MVHLINKDRIVAEIKRLKKEDGNPYFPSETADKYYARGVHFTCDGLVNFLDTIEVKEVDLEKEYDNEFFKEPVFRKLINRNAGIAIAKHFYELGLKAYKGE